MCLVLVALNSHPEYSLIVAANRDEFYDRPTAPATFWDDAPSVLAGRDLKAGGSWLAVDRQGRFAAVTNYRLGQRERAAPRSRGHLVSDFLTGDTAAAEYMEGVRHQASLYNGFNLLAGDAGGLFYYSNLQGTIRSLAPGVYGLSNHLLDTPWPKVVSTKEAFGTLLSTGGDRLISELFELLSNRAQAREDQLPATGVSQEWEHLLSSAFIATDGYGTRSSTVVLEGRDNRTVFVERSFGPRGSQGTEVRFDLVIAERLE